MIRLPETFLFLFISLILSCSKGPQSTSLVYTNDFESGSLDKITGGKIESYRNSKVLGRYNNGGFTLRLNDLPEHDLVEVSIGLYIHDSWDGNNGPDIWKMTIDQDPVINTTFSNDDCQTGYCLPQSYPNNYLTSNRMGGTGAVAKDLPSACPSAGGINTTSFYRINRTISHNKATLLIECQDLLKQTVNDPLCDESWSVEDITIRTIKVGR